MTDREMLELAAKAAGIELASWDEQGGQWIRSVDEPAKVEQTGNGWGAAVFDPLADDGDALRLATALDFNIYHAARSVFVEDLDQGIEVAVGHEKDKFVATRRAIVMAAAEIGETM